MKVAVIGTGKWGKVLLNEIRSQAVVKYECDSKTNLDKVFSDTEIKAVFIATPTNTHFEIAMQALNSNKHVFLEKPGTDSSKKLEELIKTAKNKGLSLAVGYEFPHMPAIQKLKECLAGKSVKRVIMSWQKWGTFRDSATIHLLCHEISILKYLNLGKINIVDHRETKIITSTDLVQTHFLCGDTPVESTINRVSPVKQKTITVLTDKECYLISNNGLFVINSDTLELESVDIVDESPVGREIKDFLNAIQKEQDATTNGSFAIEIHKLLEGLN